MAQIGVSELIIILVIVLLVFGSGRIAHLGRDLGTAIREFKRGLEEISQKDMTEEQ
jgi:sec-independent protein translocase protein TatA